MLTWDEYIQDILSTSTAFDSIRLSLNDESEPSAVPPIVKASIHILEKIMMVQGSNTVFVFPEKVQTSILFTLVSLIHSIFEGKIVTTYNPKSFKVGEKLKYENCVVEFNGVEVRDGKLCLKFKMADLSISAPMNILPLFQRTSTNRALSPYAKYAIARRKANEILPSNDSEDASFTSLADYKTHLDSSIFYVAPISSTKKQLDGIIFNGKRISDMFLIGQADYTGEIRNIGAGQLAGIPSIVLASDLYAVCRAVTNHAPVHFLLLDISNPNIINSQLSELDELIRSRIPIICITDTANSFDMQNLIDRGFSVWRWDEDSITESLFGESPLLADRKVKQCVLRKLEYITADCNEIGDSLKRLYSNREEIKDKHAQTIKLFDKLFSLTFTALRTIMPISIPQNELIRRELSECTISLEIERRYISETLYDDFRATIKNLTLIFSAQHILPKQKALQDHLCEQKYSAVYIIVPEKSDKNSLHDYWHKWCIANNLKTKLTFLYPAEYCNVSNTNSSATLVVGWLNNATMRKILYGFSAEKYVIFLYDYERRWKNSHTASWAKVLSSSNNKRIIEKSLSEESLEISTSRFHDGDVAAQKTEPDELDEIELVLRENKYRQYVARGGLRPADETAKAIPINFIGGYIAFYKLSHKIITATNIIIGDEEKIVLKEPSEIQDGDFVVVREASRDLIRDLADIILSNSGKPNARTLATKWKECLALELACGFSSSINEVYNKLQNVGCTRNYQTVRSWMMDEDKIAPEDKEDLLYIAKATEDQVLFEMVDQVFDAAKEVKSAHIQAGQNLSKQLRKKIASALQDYGEIDPYNIWEPISMTLEDIGTVKILKVIDVGNEVLVDTADTNHLINEA